MALAVKVAVCVVLIEATFAVNEAEDVPEGTVTLAGTVTAALLLATATLSPAEGAAEFRDTVHEALPEPVKEPLEHESALIVGVTLGLKGAFSEIETDFTMLP